MFPVCSDFADPTATIDARENQFESGKGYLLLASKAFALHRVATVNKAYASRRDPALSAAGSKQSDTRELRLVSQGTRSWTIFSSSGSLGTRVRLRNSGLHGGEHFGSEPQRALTDSAPCPSSIARMRPLKTKSVADKQALIIQSISSTPVFVPAFHKNFHSNRNVAATYLVC